MAGAPRRRQVQQAHDVFLAAGVEIPAMDEDDATESAQDTGKR